MPDKVRELPFAANRTVWNAEPALSNKAAVSGNPKTYHWLASWGKGQPPPHAVLAVRHPVSRDSSLLLCWLNVLPTRAVRLEFRSAQYSQHERWSAAQLPTTYQSHGLGGLPSCSVPAVVVEGKDGVNFTMSSSPRGGRGYSSCNGLPVWSKRLFCQAIGVGRRVWRYRDPCPANRHPYGLGARIEQSTSLRNQKGKITVAFPNIAASVFHQRRAGKLKRRIETRPTYIVVSAEVRMVPGSLFFLVCLPLFCSLPGYVPCPGVSYIPRTPRNVVSQSHGTPARSDDASRFRQADRHLSRASEK